MTQIPFTVEWWDSHTVEYHTAIKMSQHQLHATTWRNLSNIAHKRSQTQNTYSMIPCRFGSKIDKSGYKVRSQGMRSIWGGDWEVPGSFEGAGNAVALDLHWTFTMQFVIIQHSEYTYVFCAFVWMCAVLHINKLKTFNELKNKWNPGSSLVEYMKLPHSSPSLGTLLTLHNNGLF